MKEILLPILMLCSFCVHAKQWSVSNNPAIPAQFPDLNVAVNSSSVLNGDTLIIQGSGIAQPATTINKSLTIIGPGFNPNKSDILVAKMSSITIAVDNVQLIGLSFLGSGSHLFYNIVSGIQIKNCYFQFNNILPNSGFLGSKLRKTIINNCIFYGSGINLNNAPESSVMISNCLFHYFGGVVGIVASNGQLLVRNCTFKGGFLSSITNGVFKYCIFYSSTNNSTFIQNCLFKKCLYFNLTNIPGQAASSGNLGNTYTDNILSDPMFVAPGVANDQFNFTNFDYHLSPGSPAILTTAPFQLGIYGGGSTFSMTGEPFNSSIIRNFEILNPNAPVNGNLNFNIHVTPPTTN
ncbi:MAG: hypothetical protein JNM95_06490 [Chitinophagaceae bacterium]|nr:hypothetical protein [Chitinophagaceae bacterium]